MTEEIAAVLKARNVEINNEFQEIRRRLDSYERMKMRLAELEAAIFSVEQMKESGVYQVRGGTNSVYPDRELSLDICEAMKKHYNFLIDDIRKKIEAL